jgi:hypothetical protein
MTEVLAKMPDAIPIPKKISSKKTSGTCHSNPRK